MRVRESEGTECESPFKLNPITLSLPDHKDMPLADALSLLKVRWKEYKEDEFKVLPPKRKQQLKRVAEGG
jgi:hypothetical protein